MSAERADTHARVRVALSDLLETVRAAIDAGDWKVDGACDPERAIERADDALRGGT